MFKFKASYLPLLAAHMAQKDVRYYLNGVYIEPLTGNNGVILVATDGHRMAVVHDETGAADRAQIFEINPSLVSAAKKRLRKPLTLKNRVVSYQDSGRITVIDEVGNEAYIQPGFNPIIDGKYPDWRRVFPQRTRMGAGSAHVNGGYVATASEQLADLGQREMGAKHYNALSFWHNDDDSPYSQTLIVGNAAMANARVIIMPVRDGDKHPGRPDWVGYKVRPTPQEARKAINAMLNVFGIGAPINELDAKAITLTAIRLAGGVPA